MKNNILLIAVLILLAALFLPFLIKVVGALVGLAFGVVTALGVLMLAGFILIVAFSGAGILSGAVLGLVGVILLALALPFLAPLFIVLLPVILLVRLAIKS